MFSAVTFATILSFRESQPQQYLMILNIIEACAIETVSSMAATRTNKCERQLPELPLDGGTDTSKRKRVHGNSAPGLVAPMVAPNSGFVCHLVSQSDNTEGKKRNNFGKNFANSNAHNVKDDNIEIGM